MAFGIAKGLLLSSALGSKGGSTTTSVSGTFDPELEKYDLDLLRDEIGSSAINKLRKKPGEIIVVRHLPTGNKCKAMYSEGEYWAYIPPSSSGSTSKTESKSGGLLGGIFG